MHSRKVFASNDMPRANMSLSPLINPAGKKKQVKTLTGVNRYDETREHQGKIY